MSPRNARKLQLTALLLSLLSLLAAFLIPWNREGLATAGHAGIFLIALITGIAPGPTTVLVFLAAARLDPLAVGLWAGLGSAIGESSSYSAGFGSHLFLAPIHPKANRLTQSRAYRWIERNIAGWIQHHPFFTLFCFGAVPNFAIDLAGIVAGRLGYPFRRYFAAMLLGKILRFVTVAWLGGRWFA